ncbi:MAG TPA: hypothetical protein VMT20_07680 [Terriglobia bacterium]|nr:hypothetical protein [Terriglobia bacterium]
MTVFYIILCFAMGLVLLLAPWFSSWTNNFFTHHYLWVDALARNDYLRGSISGLGLADVGLGFYETSRFFRQPRAPDSARSIPSEPPLSAPR